MDSKLLYRCTFVKIQVFKQFRIFKAFTFCVQPVRDSFKFEDVNSRSHYISFCASERIWI